MQVRLSPLYILVWGAAQSQLHARAASMYGRAVTTAAAVAKGEQL